MALSLSLSVCLIVNKLSAKDYESETSLPPPCERERRGVSGTEST